MAYHLGKASLSAGYGLHSSLQPTLIYFEQNTLSGKLTNKNLEFTRSHHFVVGYDRMLTENLRLKVETYYQGLFNVPVEKTPSSYSVLNEGANFRFSGTDNLINESTGTNYGIEFTLEKFFSKQYYFLLTTSLYNSKYKGSDGIERNTTFNGRYVINALGGKEFKIGRKENILGINLRATTAGGRFETPIGLVASIAANSARYDGSRAYSEQLPAYFRADLKISYKIQTKRMTHEIALDLQNISNHENIFQRAYNPRTQTINTAYQQGFLPIPFYRLTF